MKGWSLKASSGRPHQLNIPVPAHKTEGLFNQARCISHDPTAHLTLPCSLQLLPACCFTTNPTLFLPWVYPSHSQLCTFSATSERSRLCSLPASSSRRRDCSSWLALNWASFSLIKSCTSCRVRADSSTALSGSTVEALTLSSASWDIWKYLVILSKAPAENRGS